MGGARMRPRETKKQMGQPQLGTPRIGQKLRRMQLKGETEAGTQM